MKSPTQVASQIVCAEAYFAAEAIGGDIQSSAAPREEALF
jgi:hypothetical protein